ncbi:MAG: formate/nitrite transporter family protein [Gemmatimonadota bacterium]
MNVPNHPESNAAEEPDATTAFQRSVAAGRARLERSWSALLATGFVGGIDVGVGVLALLIIEAATGSRLLGALGFPIGFIAIALARSELFTENFLVPVAPVVARKSSLRALLRLWIGTAIMNLVGGWIFTGLVIVALPDLRQAAIDAGVHFAALGIGWRSFTLGVLAGAVVTIMTWMQQGSETELGRVVAATVAAFVLAAAPLNHVIVVSLEVFAALHAGAPFGYTAWLAMAAWATLSNIVGGMLLVTVVRFVQVGPRRIERERLRRDERRGGPPAC